MRRRAAIAPSSRCNPEDPETATATVLRCRDRSARRYQRPDVLDAAAGDDQWKFRNGGSAFDGEAIAAPGN